MRQGIAAAAMVGVLCLATTGLEAGIVAQTGFNASSGIDPSDYASGAELGGKGAGEPGWTSNWSVTTAGVYTTASDTRTEGDLAAKAVYTGSGSALAYREYTDQSGVIYLDAMVKSTSSLTGDAALLYCGPNSPGFGGSATNNGTATLVGLASNGTVRLNDGIGDGSLHYEDTGFTWTAGRWVRLTQEIDVPNQTFRLWVNGVEYQAPDPLGFRRAATFVDDVQLYLSGQGTTPRSVRWDEIRILTHNPLTVGAGTGFDSSGGYPDGQTVVGKGAAEANWTDTWKMTRSGGTAVAQSAVTLGGDQALCMAAPSGDLMIHREFEDQNGLYFLDFDVRIDGDLRNAFYIYSGPDSPTHAGTGPDTGAAFMISFASDGDIDAADGNGVGGRTDEDTGFDWTAGQWTHVAAAINVANNTYTLTIDGNPVITSDPLGFRRTTMFCDDIEFLLQTQGADGGTVYIDNINVYVPEPATMTLLALGALGLLARRRRKR